MIKKFKASSKATKILVVFGGLGILAAIITVNGKKDTSKLEHSTERPPSIRKQISASPKINVAAVQERPATNTSSKRVKKRKKQNMTTDYQAQQVIIRSYQVEKIPTGAIARAKLLTRIDTRDKVAIIRASLPKGVVVNGSRKLPRLTTLFGRTKYKGYGKRVALRFSQAILPDGREITINASGKVEGQKKSLRLGQTAASLGLSMAAGVGEILTKKEALNSHGEVTPKSTVRNALYHGAGKIAQLESNRLEKHRARMLPFVIAKKGILFDLTFY